MSKVVSVHSFRGGTGKSNTTANIAALLAGKGMRVGVVDTDILSPGIHVLFGVQEGTMVHSLNDYLWGICNVEDAAIDVSANRSNSDKGKIYLIPSSMKTGDIARILREGYDVGLLNDGYERLIKQLDLDFLLIDTHPGLNEETLLSIAISDVLLIVMRPDAQDFQGTAVTVEVARQLTVPLMLLIVNKTPSIFDSQMLKQRVENSLQCDVAAILPHSDEMMALASEGVFVTKYPGHPMARLLMEVLDRFQK
ncbi:MAG: MinD/ParA family protein [Candidatus Competibacter sp.]|nr:MinD/ParA family protein [Candidatus Contendobacter sp.]MDS4068372.1 MinD/ParA family protein [Candidatus Competibacter sp.]